MNKIRCLSLPWFFWAAYQSFAAVAQPPLADRNLAVTLSSNRVALFAKLEFQLEVPTFGENPYDPADIDLRIDLTSPSGKQLWIPAFLYQPYERRTSDRPRGGPQWLHPSQNAFWLARFAPTEPGTYRGSASLEDRRGSARSAPFAFEAIASTNRGFLRVSGKDHRYLEFDNGSPFFAIGQNIAFIKDMRQQSEMIRKFGANGGNFARVWACSEDWGLAVEARKSAWGRSWDWNPPFAICPDRDGYHQDRLCIKLSGDSSTVAHLNPCYPIALKPGARYVLSGTVRGTAGVGLTFDLGGPQTVTGERRWTRFTNEFVAADNQWFLPNPSFALSAKGTAWIKDLSLKAVGGGPELLWEADPNRPPLGVYNQIDADMLDRIVQCAEESGVYLQLVFLTRDHYMGLLNNRSGRDYETATDFAQRIARYFVARWGYSTHVAAWEYFNEMDPGLPTEKFYRELAQYLEEVDVNRHLRVNSTWHSPSKDFRNPDLDVANLHHYLRPPSGEIWKDEVASVLAQWQLNQKALEKRPLFFAEFGITDANWQRAPQLSQDRDFVHLHNALWLTATLGFGSTVCHWYWDDIHQRDLYSVYRPLARFSEGIPFNAGNLANAQATCDKALKVFGQQNAAFAYLWIWDPQATWWNVAMEKRAPAAIQGAKLTLANLKPGAYRVEWWDTRAGKIVNQPQIEVTREPATLDVPDFAGDIACKITSL